MKHGIEPTEKVKFGRKKRKQSDNKRTHSRRSKENTFDESMHDSDIKEIVFEDSETIDNASFTDNPKKQVKKRTLKEKKPSRRGKVKKDDLADIAVDTFVSQPKVEPEKTENPEEVDVNIFNEPENQNDGYEQISTKFSVFITLIIVALFVLGGFVGWKYFSVNAILVDGCIAYEPAQIVELSGIEYGSSMFVTDFEIIIDNIEKDPLIKVFGIKKVWPDRLLIEIDERIPKTTILHEGTYILIDDEANVLGITETTDASKYPLTVGIKVLSYEVSQKLDISNKDNLEVLIKLLKALDEKDSLDVIDQINVTSVNHIVLYCQNDIIIDVGTIDSITDKATWISNMIPRLIAVGDPGTLYLTTNGGASFLPNPKE